MDNRIMKKRIRTVYQELSKKGINCLVITKPANVTYTTGFMGDDSWVVIAGCRIYLLTDSRYTEQARKECVGCKIIEHDVSLPKAAAKLVEKLKSVRVVAIEKSASIADFELLKKNIKVRLKTVADIIDTTRSIKDSSEIAALKTATKMALKALKETLPNIKPGMTENELAGLLNLQIRRHGATDSFDTIAAFGPNASYPHHRSSERKLKSRDNVLIDFGVKYKGYCCDVTRCFYVGKPTVIFKKIFDTVKKAQAAAIKMIKPGVEMGKVDAAAREVIRKSGLPVYGHSTGHGLGLEVHELPVIKPKNKARLEPGHVITIEPGVYMPGKVGVRMEDDILVTKTGCEILTGSCPHVLLLANRKG